MNFEKQFPLDRLSDEFGLWMTTVKPLLSLPPNVLSLCEYGFTEMVNNAMDHSSGKSLVVRTSSDQETTTFEIEDNGVGIFLKLSDHFHFDSEIHALIELVKGKLTVAPEHHSGEGLFFSSKLFDKFEIKSGSLQVVFHGARCDVRQIQARPGTLIRMEIANRSPRTITEIFDQFCGGDDYTFYKTRFLVSLAVMEGSLVSRSQAKRVAARLDKFAEVELDFLGVEAIGQGFADELFRVWPLAHKNTQISVINANPAISKMLGHIRSRTDLPQVKV